MLFKLVLIGVLSIALSVILNLCICKYFNVGFAFRRYTESPINNIKIDLSETD